MSNLWGGDEKAIQITDLNNFCSFADSVSCPLKVARYTVKEGNMDTNEQNKRQPRELPDIRL